MEFAFSEEQEELRRYVRQWLDERSPSSEVRKLMESVDGYDQAQWRAMAEMGWQAMAVPEDYGGAGFGFLELFVILEEQGRSLLCAPFFSSVVLAGTALLEGGSEVQKSEWLPRIASGDTTATVAHAEPGLRGRDAHTTARRTADGWLIAGTKTNVIDGHTADLLVVSAMTGSDMELFLVPATSPGVHRRPLDTLDQTRKQAEIRLDGVTVPLESLLGDSEAGVDTLARVLDVGAVGLAAEQVGGAERCLEMAVDYAKERQQFGRPIGSFQAIKHKCADMLVRVEAAGAAAHYAAWTIATRADEARTAVPLAKAGCSETFTHCAGENIQIHGGIGFTWEHDAHLYLKRARSSEVMMGDPEHHRRRLADLVL